jgi:hypothetical protein
MNRLDDCRTVVPHINAPQAGKTVQKAAILRVDYEATISRFDPPRTLPMHLGMVRKWVYVMRRIFLAQLLERGAAHIPIYHWRWPKREKTYTTQQDSFHAELADTSEVDTTQSLAPAHALGGFSA